MIMKQLYSLVMYFFLPCILMAQEIQVPLVVELHNKDKAILFHITAGGHIPGADMAKRFGLNGSIGGRIESISKSNWLFGVEGEFYFGNDVRENPLEILELTEGYIIGNDRSPASIYLLQRGYGMDAYVGRLFSIGQKRSGVRITVGGGFTRHKIRIQDDTRTVTQITGDYQKGYDRFSGGLALNQFIGWQHVGKTRHVNFTIGIECNQGFTNTLRDWDFNEMRKLDESRLDLRFGLRASWILPFYMTKSDEIYY